MKLYEKRRLKYGAKDSSDQIFREIRNKAELYFAASKSGRNANIYLYLKIAVLGALAVAAYVALLHAHSGGRLLGAYMLLGFSLLIMGINVGHDAAHHCLTGKRKTDDFIFQLVFGLQGLSGYFWQMRHNYSHHIFPNVYEYDTDMEITELILLNPKQKVRPFHQYQHLYAPFLYMLFSLVWIFYQDFALFFKKDQANLKITGIPAIEWVKLFAVKILYIGVFLYLPLYFSHLHLGTVLGAFILMNFALSVFLAFTFFISHHVVETSYYEVDEETHTLNNSWLCHQIVTTVDFNADSPVANFLFGGFNLHVAHHLFPETSHIHYPALTRIIRETLEEHELNWYQSFDFFHGVYSHLVHLKYTARNIIGEPALSQALN